MGKITKSHVNNFEYTKICFYKFFATYARGGGAHLYGERDLWIWWSITKFFYLGTLCTHPDVGDGSISVAYWNSTLAGSQGFSYFKFRI